MIVETRYFPPGNSRGARIKAFDATGRSITISYPHGAHDPHEAAVRAWMQKFRWQGKIIGSGDTKAGQAFCLSGHVPLADDSRAQRAIGAMRENPDENERRIATERKIVRRLIREAINAGWRPVYVYDGEQQVRVESEKAALDVVFSVDESTITFQNAEGKRAGALIVLGNYYDVFVDYNPTPGFNEAMERVQDYVNELQEREA